MTKLIRDEIWILSDGRAGNYSQAFGLVVALGLSYKIIDISYGFFSILPNIILQSSLLSLDKKSREKLRGFDYFPKLIISAGRREAPIVLYLKKQSQNQTKIVQIMNPNLCFSKFDFVILPYHDKIKTVATNVLRSVGALTKISDEAIKNECEKYRSWFANNDKKSLAVFLGGDTKKTKFSSDAAKKLAQKVAEIANNMGLKLYVLNSRRTSDEVSEIVKSILQKEKCDFKFFDFKELRGENPYLAILGFADFFVVTADSVSMISESCSTGKSVYVFDDEKISTKKHKNFLKYLLLEKYVRLLETKRIAEIINMKLK